MLTAVMKWIFVLVLLLVLLWPRPAGYYVWLGLAVCVPAIWVVQARRNKYLQRAAYIPASPKVKYEN
jgi:hypothetical protein